MITITVNNKPQSAPKNISLQQFLTNTVSSTQGIAVAINQEIIAKANWENKVLFNGDTILIIQATQGG
ncbi:sulfur carrier protein ThiS [Seonamhaeicola algicola]|uniref:Sulfur carrier protein ThiS n=2 Tax=Seonamhaeicola TaxID=1649495 RepID=A0A5C7AV03_9FLAO|nr:MULTISPECIES: sulfur carrier protein ThiS [Seonamhaeicola]TXE09582.1 sulfur carrier protein ThiS [Seonamhaeicola algicola]TYA91242.1 sulfur carrier protein ThiS [Seonamhaeicola marinus]